MGSFLLFGAILALILVNCCVFVLFFVYLRLLFCVFVLRICSSHIIQRGMCRPSGVVTVMKCICLYYAKKPSERS